MFKSQKLVPCATLAIIYFGGSHSTEICSNRFRDKLHGFATDKPVPDNVNFELKTPKCISILIRSFGPKLWEEEDESPEITFCQPAPPILILLKNYYL